MLPMLLMSLHAISIEEEIIALCVKKLWKNRRWHKSQFEQIWLQLRKIYRRYLRRRGMAPSETGTKSFTCPSNPCNNICGNCSEFYSELLLHCCCQFDNTEQQQRETTRDNRWPLFQQNGTIDTGNATAIRNPYENLKTTSNLCTLLSCKEPLRETNDMSVQRSSNRLHTYTTISKRQRRALRDCLSFVFLERTEKRIPTKTLAQLSQQLRSNLLQPTALWSDSNRYRTPSLSTHSNRERRESSQEEENSTTKKVENSSLSSRDMLPNIRVRIPESQTTDGENSRSDSRTWCKVAYWELTTRVGDFYFAKKPSVNISLSNAYCKEQISEEVNLHKLCDARKTPCKVQDIRQKIGLGIALSEESNGVWLFNRSMEPIFVHSPTLCESWFQVCKVFPGHCLKAFDYQKARDLKDPSQLPGAQAGPVDKYSMRISFVKGYGMTYKRQDVTQCPCWLEVHFTKR